MNPTIEQLVDRALDTLAEHCDSVRIFVTWRTDDGTDSTGNGTQGRGNLSAQIEEARTWVRLMDREKQKVFDADQAP